MAEQNALINVMRDQGIMRDIPLRESAGNWEIPSLPLRAAPGCE